MNSISTIVFIIGLLGSITTIACFLPQCIKTIKTRDTSGLSLLFFLIAILSSIFWLIYGGLNIYITLKHENNVSNALRNGLPIILTNIITIVINTIIIFIKVNNISKAKKNNITEHEYCNRIVK